MATGCRDCGEVGGLGSQASSPGAEGARLHLLSTGSAQASGCRLPPGQMWNTFQLRVGFGGGDQMFVDDDAGQWAGMDFGSQTWVCLRIN